MANWFPSTDGVVDVQRVRAPRRLKKNIITWFFFHGFPAAIVVVVRPLCTTIEIDGELFEPAKVQPEYWPSADEKQLFDDSFPAERHTRSTGYRCQITKKVIAKVPNHML
ncbi:unnamed protein product [Nippostrongylus brasiliensis]|uniref:Transmembrane protein n=1 Tax=Nippostrongylus brasiliensis TaxID=27835 RepID=A0A0N4Y0I9_NIPBR|nr:unnamed protein product [Nippostrongylus brasiliensis]